MNIQGKVQNYPNNRLKEQYPKEFFQLVNDINRGYEHILTYFTILKNKHVNNFELAICFIFVFIFLLIEIYSHE